MESQELKEYTRKMNQALEVLSRDFAGLRTGRASAQLLEPVKVDSYGALVPITQVGSITVSDSRMLLVQVWDRGLVRAVEKAIRESNLGVNPSIDGQNIRVPVPALNEERRNEITKIASKYAEDSKIAIRNIRRDAMDTLKTQEKKKEISEDEHKKMSAEVQKLTDEFIGKIEKLLSVKEKEISQV